jgi:hypothetical protein
MVEYKPMGLWGSSTPIPHIPVLQAGTYTAPQHSPRLEHRTPPEHTSRQPEQLPIRLHLNGPFQGLTELHEDLRGHWQLHLTRDPALKAEVNRLQRSVTLQLQECRNDEWSDTLEALHPEDQSLWGMTKRVMRVTTPTPPRGELLSWTPRKPRP